MEDKFVELYGKVVDEQNDILEKTANIKKQVENLEQQYQVASTAQKKEIVDKLKQLDGELEKLETRSIKNAKRANKLKSMK